MRTTELVARLRLDASQFDKSVKQSQAELQAFSRVAGALPGGRSSIFGALAADAANLAPVLTSVPLGIAAVGAALAGAGIAARRAGVEFEASLAKISTLGPEAKASLEATRDAILDTYASVPVTGGVTDLAEANYLLQSSGRSAAEAVVDLRVAAEASVAGYASVTTAVDGLTTVTNAWKDSQITTQQASDVLFSAVNVGKATFDEIAQSIGLVAPIAAAAGVRFQEVAAATAVLSNQGVRTSSIFEGLRSAIVNIQRPTEAFKKAYGDLAEEFGASRLARDGIIKFLQDFQVASGNSGIALRALFTDATAQVAVNGLLANSGEDAAAALKKMEDASGATGKALKEVNATAKAQEQLVRNQIASAWTQFGTLLSTVTLPILEKVARVLNDITDNAAFAKGDVQKLIATSGTELQDGKGIKGGRGFDQANALRGVVQQFKDDRKQFLANLSRDELEQLGPELIRLRASGRYQQNPRTAISADLVNSITDERLTRDVKAESDRLGGFDAADVAKKAAEKKADEEKAAARRADTLAKATAASADAARDAKQKADELARQREDTLKEADQLIKQLRAKGIEATQGVIGVIRENMRTVIAEAQAQLDSGILDPARTSALEAQVAQFAEINAQLLNVEVQAKQTEAALTAAANTEQKPALEILAARERELIAVLKTTSVLSAQKDIEAQLAKLAAARGGLTEKNSSLPDAADESRLMRERISAYGDLAQSIATVGDQLGLLPKRAVDALRGIGALAEQGSQLAKAFSSGSGIGLLGKIGIGIGIAGGVASLAAGLFGESPEDKQRREDIRTNTAALRKLTERVGDLASSAVSGDQLSRARAATDRLSGARGFTGVAELSRFLSNADVQSVAKELGIVLTSATGIDQFRKALATADLNAYVNSFTGSLQRLDDTLRADGVTDAVEILRRRVAVLTDANTGFPALADALAGVDLSSAEGRLDATTRTRSLFEQLSTGSLTASQLGGLSVQDARTTLVDLITSLRDTTASAGTGGFNETRTITEVTGSRLAGLFSSANQYLSTIAADVARLRDAIVVGVPLPLLAPPPGLFGAAAGGGTTIVFQGGITVQLTLSADVLRSGAAGLSDAATRLGAGIGDAVMTSIDQKLRERALKQKLLTGDARLSR